jgi:hypothetical protein
MTTELRRTLPNWITFPRELRDAIPDFKPSLGRVLQLECADVAATDTVWTGHRVAVKLTVCETGKLMGSFDIGISLDPHAALSLADLLRNAAERAMQ